MGYLLAELVVMPLVAMRAPLSLRVQLPAPLFILGQSSWDGLRPSDYVLVLGDSYAQGNGDWLAEVDRSGNPPFHSTHLIHERTGRDVVSFGHSGAGSVAAMAYLVEKRFAALARMGFGRPAEVLVCFYEGNDLNNNLRAARRYFGLEDRSFESFTDEELDRAIAARARKGFWNGLSGNLYFPYTLLEVLQGRRMDDGHVGLEKRRPAPQDSNLVRVGDRVVSLGRTVQSPAMELTEPELAFAIRILERCLVRTRQRFGGVRVTLAYVPSPIACYHEIASETVRIRTYEGRADEYPASEIEARSGEIRRRVSGMVEALDMRFVDLTPHLREASRSERLHGEVDRMHFNERGYAIMGEILSRELTPR